MERIGVGRGWLLAVGFSLGTPFLASCGAEPAGNAAQEDTSAVEQAVITNPQVDFSSKPTYIPSKTVVLTFDDGPDTATTPKVLDILKTNNIKATFFVNTINWTDVNTNATARAIVQRMVDEGHELGNHTIHHYELGKLGGGAETNTQIENEIAGVENTLRPLIGSRRLSLLRAPYGIPYDPTRDVSKFGLVAPIVAKHAVHIGWNINSQDQEACSGNSNCVLTTVQNAIIAGSYGVILMHSTSASTAPVLQQLIDFLKARGFAFGTTEDVVRGRFGATTSSAEVVDGQFASVSRRATDDAYVRDGSFAATNFGTATDLSVKTSTSGFSRDAYLKFDISALPTFSKAKLRIFARLEASPNFPVNVYSVASTTWTEASITWNNKPARGTTALQTITVSGTSLGAYDFDVTSYVQGQKAAGKTAVSFALHAPNVTVKVAIANSDEAANSRPQLVITP